MGISEKSPIKIKSAAFLYAALSPNFYIILEHEVQECINLCPLTDQKLLLQLPASQLPPFFIVKNTFKCTYLILICYSAQVDSTAFNGIFNPINGVRKLLRQSLIYFRKQNFHICMLQFVKQNLNLHCTESKHRLIDQLCFLCSSAIVINNRKVIT